MFGSNVMLRNWVAWRPSARDAEVDMAELRLSAPSDASFDPWTIHNGQWRTGIVLLSMSPVSLPPVHEITLITTIAFGLTAALVFGLLARRLGLSPIVGYLIAGMVVGPYTPGFVGDIGLAKQLAEIGVILLMFGVGLHFHFSDLMAVRGIAIPGALGQSAAATICGLGVAVATGWSLASGTVLGLAVSVASTVVLLRVLTDDG